MNLTKIIVLYIFAFILIYMGPTQIGPTTFSQLWKIPLFAFLVYQVLIIRNKKTANFIKWSYARAAKNLITTGFSVSYLAGFIDFFRYMMFPLMYQYILIKIKALHQLDKLLLGFAQFVIISGIPFVFGVLQSKAMDTMANDVSHSFAGMFQNSHGAAITTSTAVLILWSFLKSKSNLIKHTVLNHILLIFGVYLIYLTFIRTGYVMFIIGLLFIYAPKKANVKQVVSSAFVIAVVAIGVYFLLETNEQFYNRIFDIRNGKQTAAGSGRLIFWEAAVELWYNGNFPEMIFGFGFNGLVDHIYSVVGLRVYAHNEFFTQLGQNGLLGVIFFIGFLIALLKHILNRKNLPSYKLALAIYFLYVSLMMTQGGMWFELDVFMALVFAKLEFEQLLYKKAKKKTFDNQLMT